MTAQIEGDLDMRAFFAIRDEVRRGYNNIKVTFKVKTDEQNLEKLKTLSEMSRVLDVTSNGTKVDVTIERK